MFARFYELINILKIENSWSVSIMDNVYNSYLFNEFVCGLGFFWHEWVSL
jgi:hypothetical protein